MSTRLTRSPAARAALLGLAMALGAAACASAGKRYEQGMELEQRGRPAEAAERYIDALKKDPSLAGARERLREAGDQAVADYLADAERHEATGRPGEAAEALLRLDALRRDASSVGVTLGAPADYAARRRATLDRAVDFALAESDDAARRGEFSEALRLLDRAQSRWQPTPAQRIRLDDGRFATLLGWAGREADAGRFRSAFQRAEQAAVIFASNPSAAARARALQDDVLRRGTMRVAVLPPEVPSSAERRLPAGFVTALQDELETEHWARPPRFVDVIDPREVRREVRRRGTPAGGVMGTREASIVGRALGAEVAVLLGVDSVAAGETVSRTERRTARTREGADTAYTVREGRAQTWARMTYALVDVEMRQVLERGTVTAEGDARFRRATYAGDWRTLNLTRAERELFTEGSGDERELARELTANLASRLGREVYESVLRRID